MVEKKAAEKKEASTGGGIRMITEPSGEVAEGSEKPEETMIVGTLTIRYVNDTPEITLNNGSAIPGEIAVVDTLGNPVARYTGSALPAGPTARTRVVPGVLHPEPPAGLAVPIVGGGGGLLSDRALKRDVVGVVWA